MRNARFFADAQNDIVVVGGFRRPDICRLISVICRLNCHPEHSEGSGCNLDFLRFFADTLNAPNLRSIFSLQNQYFLI